MTREIQFGCTLCGECCSGSMKVFVNSHDLYKMASFLKMSHSSELFKHHYIMLDRGQNALSLPRIRFKSRPFPFCPHLVNDFQEGKGLRGLCSLHLDHKPLICRLAPLSRNLNLKTGEEDFNFILPHPGCPGPSIPQILKVEDEKKTLAKELSYEKRYYQLLSDNEENPHFLWNFPLNRPFETLMKAWEEGRRP